MNLDSAFTLATAFSYLAAAVYAALGKPAMVDFPTRLQGAFYFGLFVVLLYVSYNPGIWILNLILGVFYSFATVASFTGLQKWMAYWKDDPKKGSGALQVGMAYWDLALAVDFLYIN